MRIGDLVARVARYSLNKLATVFKDVRLKHKELNDRAYRVGNAILNIGMGKEDRIGIICNNSRFYTEDSFVNSNILLLDIMLIVVQPSNCPELRILNSRVLQ